MNQRRKKILSALVLGATTIGTAGVLMLTRRKRRRSEYLASNSWVRPGMMLTFRAELKPGRPSSERTFKVSEILDSGRVLLEGLSGEHAETEFQKMR